MEHLFLLLDALSLIVGFGGFIGFTYVTFKSKHRLMLHIWLFFTAFTMDMAFNTIYFYFINNLPDLYRAYFSQLFYLQISISALLVFSIPFFFAELVQLKHRRFINFTFGAIALVQLFGSVMTQYSELLFRFGILSAILFTIVTAIARFSDLKNTSHEKLIIRITLLGLAAFAINLLQLFQLITLFRILVPFIYLSFCLIFYLHFVDTYFRSNPNSEQTLQKFDQYHFTKREKEIVDLLLQGFNNQKIANKLHISLSTVKTHVRNSFQKAKVNNRYEFIHLMKFS